ncbi:MAG: phosphoenolpyruvate synthase [Candidatus Pacearchaeota archaeon]|nr:phosphoenolpyruvate synthase [Candidatus Pacearchaeota archaeon]
MEKRVDFIKWFSELESKDTSLAGGKGVGLAEMYNNKFPVPVGFVITTGAYQHFIDKNKISDMIKIILQNINTEDSATLKKASEKISDIIMGAGFPDDLKREIIESYEILDVDRKKFEGAAQGALDILRNSHEPPFVAVRSSAISEDGKNASFAGQQESFLNVKGNDSLLLNVKKAFASLFSPRAMYYRKKKGFKVNEKTAVVIQRMVDSQKSGVMFSKNPIKDDNNLVIEAVFGLGSGIASGMISPDYYVMDRNSDIVERKVSDKGIALTRNSSGKTEVVSLTPEISKREVLTGHELKMLVQFASKLEEHYKKPQDVEFAIDKNGIYIVQSRAITSKHFKDESELDGNVLVSGIGASPGIVSGVVKIVNGLEDLNKVQKGNILVVKNLSPEIAISLHRVGGIITDLGGMASHTAILSREMGIPLITGSKNAMEKLKDGQVVTVDGFTGRIIEGLGVERKMEINKVVPTKTKINVVLDLPDYALRAAQSGARGVGLVRLESLIAVSGKHPVWYVKNDKLDDYIANIYEGLKKIAHSFEEIWVRSLDIKSDEYKNLEGSPEINELNPLLGDTGVRFSLKNIDLLEAEFKAIKELADEYGNKKFGVMASQIISVEEIKEIKEIAKKVGMPENVKIGVMIETPAAVQIINSLCEEGIDFVNLGISNLTQYTLIVDKNNEEVKELYNEMHPAVLNSIAYVLRRCKKYKVETALCEQTATNPDLIEFLVENGIGRISVNADAAFEVSEIIAEIEERMLLRNSLEGDRNNKDNGVSGIDRGESEKEVSEKDNNLKDLTGDLTRIGNGKNVDEEQLILQALDDEYSPGIEKENDIPKLNEAIPVGSEDFEERKNDEVMIELPGIPEESFYFNEKENKKDKIDIKTEEEIGGDIYEVQKDTALNVEANREVQENPGNEFGQKEEWQGEKKKPEDEILDIF